jgi:hypothetical protein
MKRYFVIFTVLLSMIIAGCTSKSAPGTGGDKASYAYHFADGLDGWKVSAGTLGLTVLTYEDSPDNAAQGTTGTAKLTYNFNGTTTDIQPISWFLIDLSSSVDFSGRTVSLWIKAPLSIATMDGYTVKFAMYNGTWTTVPFTPSLISTADTFVQYNCPLTQIPDIAGVTSAAIIIIKNTNATADWSGDLYLDEITW